MKRTSPVGAKGRSSALATEAMHLPRAASAVPPVTPAKNRPAGPTARSASAAARAARPAGPWEPARAKLNVGAV